MPIYRPPRMSRWSPVSRSLTESRHRRCPALLAVFCGQIVCLGPAVLLLEGRLSALRLAVDLAPIAL